MEFEKAFEFGVRKILKYFHEYLFLRFSTTTIQSEPPARMEEGRKGEVKKEEVKKKKVKKEEKRKEEIKKEKMKELSGTRGQ